MSKPPIEPNRPVRIAFAAAGLAAVPAAIRLAGLPAEPGSAVLLGFSAGRLALLGFLAAGGLLFLVLATLPHSILGRLTARLGKPAPVYAAWVVFLAIGSAAGYALTGAPALRQPFFDRLFPLFAWLAAAALAVTAAAGSLAFGRAPRERSEAAQFPAAAASSQKTGRAPFANPQRALPLPLLFLIVFTAAWFPRSLDLDRFVTVDEPTWLEQSEIFLLAITRGDLEESYVFEHPALTLLWAQSLGFRLHLGRDAGILDDPELTPARLEAFFENRNVDTIDLLASGRYAIAFLSAATIALAAVYAARLLGWGPALAGGLLLAMDPFHIAHTRLLTMDGLLASTMALSLVAFLAHLETGRRDALLVSGAAAGLSWLTKTPGWFLLPIVGALGILHAFRKDTAIPPTRRLAAVARTGLVWFMLGGLTFFALFPALWAAPLATLRDMFADTLLYAAEGHRGAVFYAGRIFPDGRIGGVGFALVNFLWRTTPAVLAGLALLPWMWRERRFSDRAVWRLLLAAGLFVLLQSAGTKKFDRYFLAAVPLLDLAAGVGFVYAASRVRWSRISAAAAAAGLALLVLWPVAATYPYYLSYYNPLLGGAARAPEIMMIGWGEGLDEAARYLNERPDHASLSVISWYNRGSFDYFFEGESESLPTNQEPRPERLAEILAMDYAVIYIHQWQRRAPENLLAALEGRTPEHVVWIDGIEYVRIYRLGE